jgi:hypothetical protein
MVRRDIDPTTYPPLQDQPIRRRTWHISGRSADLGAIPDPPRIFGEMNR